MFHSVRNISASRQSIFRWFIIRFLSFSLICLMALVPSLSYCKNIFTELEIQKSTQHMSFGVSQLESTVTGVNSASTNLRQDLRFLPFYYSEVDYFEIPTITGMQLQDYLDSLMFPLSLVKDWSLQFDSDIAITPYRFISKSDVGGFYYDTLQIDDLTYEQWTDLLIENRLGFMSVHRVAFHNKPYDALIYSVPWTNDSFIFACLDVKDIKASLIEKDHIDTFFFSISRSDGTLLYSDLPDSEHNYHSVTQKTAIGNLVVTVHIPESILGEQMRPLYYFIGIYILIFALILAIAIYVGSHVSSQPLMQIIDILENPKTNKQDPAERFSKSISKSKLQYGFQYIQNELHTYKRDLVEYQNTIETQEKVLQARYLEKAIHGSLVTDSDYNAFYSYFPEFPEEFCLILLGLNEKASGSGNIYPDSLSLIQVLLTSCLPNAYLQQISRSELLIIIDAEQYSECSAIANHVIANINRHEPCYHAWGIVSKYYNHPKDISSAFEQLQDMHGSLDLTSLSQLCSISDDFVSRKTNFQMADVLSIHSAIIYGNKDLALLKLHSYSCNLNRSVYEMFRSILLCIKQDYPELFLDVRIPAYHTRMDMYSSLQDQISVFCERFQQKKENTVSGSFPQEVRSYIDLHFTEDDLSYTRLADHFQCSSSKLSKAFLKEYDMTIPNYIEKKRMDLATQLLTTGEYTVVEVARRSGFTNTNTFHKAYKRVFGHTPAALKEKKD